jgi:uncharacterized membrane protein YqiK
VVVSYTGRKGSDLSGKEYSHGELVESGCRGVWRDPLMPGKYAFNTYAGKIELVPTTNFVLMWKSGESGSSFDNNLREITLITKDAFEPQLPLSVVVHIDYRKAPLVVQRFGDIKRLVDQTLDPMVSAYFKNIGQTKTLIQLIQNRADIQQLASVEMMERFAAYNLELQEVLIGTPHGSSGNPSGARIDTLLNQLRDRQVAIEQVATFELQEQSAVKERSLREARAKTDIQAELTNSVIHIEIKKNVGDANVVEATKRANVIGIDADAERRRLTAEGDGRASAIAAVGKAEAEAIEAKSTALTGEGARLQLINTLGSQFADAIRDGHIAIVPKISLGGGDAGGNGLSSLIQLASSLLAERADAGMSDGKALQSSQG